MADWSNFQQIYLFPPVTILPDSLSKITESTRKGLLIAPLSEWPCFSPDGLKGIS